MAAGRAPRSRSRCARRASARQRRPIRRSLISTRRGLRGDEQAVVDCISALEAKLAIQPNDQLARVYLGSAWTLRSRDLPIGPGKLSALRKGIALMDEAAAAAPNDADVLLLRAVTNEALPVFLGRRKVARAQLDELLALVGKRLGETETGRSATPLPQRRRSRQTSGGQGTGARAMATRRRAQG